MNVYHITFYTSGKSICIYFKGCNFRCLGCIRKRSTYDFHLPTEVQRKLPSEQKLLKLHEVIEIINSMKPRSVIITGGEPTMDPQLLDLIRELKGEVHLDTNGFFLTPEYVRALEEAGLRSLCLSIKAYDDNIHRFYTGQSNYHVLNAVNIVRESKIKLTTESLLIPELIGEKEISRIAKFLASIDTSISYRLDSYIPVPEESWRSPSKEKMLRAGEESKKYLKYVYYFTGEEEFIGEIFSLFPNPEDQK